MSGSVVLAVYLGGWVQLSTRNAYGACGARRSRYSSRRLKYLCITTAVFSSGMLADTGLVEVVVVEVAVVTWMHH